MASTLQSVMSLLLDNPVAAAVSDSLSAFTERRQKLGLPNPGNVENLSKEVTRELFLTNMMFSGVKADLTRVVSLSPLFQVSHQFCMIEAMSPYSFSAMYGVDDMFLQASYENTSQFSGRANYRLTPNLMAKVNMQLSPRADMASFESEYSGVDFTSSVRAMNPSFLSGGLTGIVMGNYLQSVTPRLALGLEAVWQRQAMTQGPDANVSYIARYRAGDGSVTTAQLIAQGALNMTYWRRISDKAQAGAEVQLSLVPTGGPGGGVLAGPTLRREGLTTFGVRYDFKLSTMRAQVDSKGRLGLLLEKKMMMPITFQFAADVDYFSQQARVGMGFTIEITPEEILQAQELGTIRHPNIPF